MASKRDEFTRELFCSDLLFNALAPLCPSHLENITQTFKKRNTTPLQGKCDLDGPSDISPQPSLFYQSMNPTFAQNPHEVSASPSVNSRLLRCHSACIQAALRFLRCDPKAQDESSLCVTCIYCVLLLLMGGDDRFIRRAIIVVREFGAACTFRHPVG